MTPSVCSAPAWRETGVRWMKFNFVGALGVFVQLAALALFVGGFGLAYLPATGLAVEAAVLHNFAWHERFTWRDLIPRAGRLGRLARFNLTTGAVSIGGNLILMRALVGTLHVHWLVANAVSIAVCSVANFAASNWFVFRRSGDTVRG